MENISTDILVLGGGPGGYTAAFRAADLGKNVVIVERQKNLGGTCLNVGCIPSKALLHAAKVIEEAEAASKFGISFQKPEVDIDSLRQWKDKLVKKLAQGLKGLAKQRKVKLVSGIGKFIDQKTLVVENEEGEKTLISFNKAIIAAGSRSIKLPFAPKDKGIIDSKGALEIDGVPPRMLIIGGGIIGLEMATFYSALGSEITIVELADGLIQGCDKDIVKPLERIIKRKYKNIYLSTKVVNISKEDGGFQVDFEDHKKQFSETFDKVLISVGRSPNSDRVGANKIGLNIDTAGFIVVDESYSTNIENIYAIGDIVGQPMLAHKAVFEGKAVAEIIAGDRNTVGLPNVPSVAYTDPEIAWVGETEISLSEKDIEYGIGVFPWAASGRSLSMGRNEGITKIIFDKTQGKILGGAIVGPNAGELISEITLAIESNLTAHDIEKVIHPHPTLSESILMSAEMFTGSITDLMPKP